MRNAAPGAETLRQNLEQSLRELEREREDIRRRLQDAGGPPQQWAELERQVCIAELVGRKPTPSARRTVDGTLAAVRAFRAALPQVAALH